MRASAILLVALAACALAPARGDAPTIDRGRIRAHVAYLADDLLEGRGTGARGGALAARYLVAQAQALGLAPGASADSYLQPVPLVATETQEGSTIRLDAPGAPGAPAAWLDEFVAADETLAESTTLACPVVFVGHGIVAPEQNWNDYEGADVRGKIVMILANEPGRAADDPSLFGGRALTYYGRWTYKYEEAARQGAAGALLVHTDETAGYGWSVVRNSWGRERPFPPDPERALRCAAWIQEKVAREALTRAGKDLGDLAKRAEIRGFRALETSLTATVDLKAKTRRLDAHNVLALLPGSDPERSKEAVILTAHYDHLGIGQKENGDGIYNGAVDNASGCAALLEIARVLAASPTRPPRSILFAWVTGEEGGLRGSEHYARKPTFPREKMVANLNLDGLPVQGDPIEIAPLGYQRSTLRPLVERTAEAMGMRPVAERDPAQGYFFRSDHFHFAKIGVPALSVSGGLAYRDKPSDYGQAMDADYRKNRYHRPADQFDPSWDLVATAKIAEFTLRVARELAEGTSMPAFLPGDEFAAAQPARKP